MPSISTGNINYPAARSHPALDVCPTFKPISRGQRRPHFKISHYFKNGDEMTITASESLGEDDRDVLLAILAVARAQDRGLVVDADPDDTALQQLRDGLMINSEHLNQMSTLMIHVGQKEFLRELGRATTGSARAWLNDSLERLATVTFTMDQQYDDNRRIKSSFHLLSFSLIYDNNDGIYSILLNPMSAIAIASNDQGYVLHHRIERQLLKNDSAKALHSALCRLVRMGSSRSLSVDMLAANVYHSDAVTKQQRQQIIAAAKKINLLAYWLISEIDGRGVLSTVTVERKKRS